MAERDEQITPPHIHASWDRLAWASTLAAGGLALGLLNIIAQAKDQDAALSALTIPLAFLGLAAAAGGLAATVHTSIRADLALNVEIPPWKLRVYINSQSFSLFGLATAFIWVLALHHMGTRIQPVVAAPGAEMPAAAASRKLPMSDFHRP